MSLLINLNEEGFLSIKNDRLIIKQKINDLYDEIDSLKMMLEEFEVAYVRLKDFYEPIVTIKRNRYGKYEYYQGIAKLEYPVPKVLKVNLGQVKSYKGDDDKSLKVLAEQKMNELIKKEFPLYF